MQRLPCPIILTDTSSMIGKDILMWYDAGASQFSRALSRHFCPVHLEIPLFKSSRHRLNMKLNIQSLFGLLCTAARIGWDPATPPLPPPAFGLIYEDAIGQPR